MPPSIFAKHAGHSILAGLISQPSISRTATLEEKWPTFALLRRIRDHPELTLGSPGHSSYPDIVTSKGDTLTKLVSEWADEWLEDTRDDADVEKRLEGMVEEVVWGNVIWFGPGGWHACSESSRPFNPDFFVCVLSFLHVSLY